MAGKRKKDSATLARERRQKNREAYQRSKSQGANVRNNDPLDSVISSLPQPPSPDEPMDVTDPPRPLAENMYASMAALPTSDEEVRHADMNSNEVESLRRHNPDVLMHYEVAMELDETQVVQAEIPSNPAIPLPNEQPATSYALDWYNREMEQRAADEAWIATQAAVLIQPEVNDEFDEEGEQIEPPDYTGLHFNSLDMQPKQNDRTFNSTQIINLLGAMAGKASQEGGRFNKITVLSPKYLQDFPQGNFHAISNYLICHKNKPDLIICNINLVGQENAVMVINLLPEKPIALYFDPSPIHSSSREIFDDQLNACNLILRDLRRIEMIGEDIDEVIKASPATYNLQVNNYPSIFFVFLIIEHIAFKGLSFKLQPLNHHMEFVRYQFICKALFDFNQNKAIPENIPRWPAICLDRINDRPFGNVIDTPRELRDDNDLIRLIPIPPMYFALPTSAFQLRRSQRVQPMNDHTKQLYDDAMTRNVNSCRGSNLPIGRRSAKINHDEHYLGPMNHRCVHAHCRAYLFKGEGSSGCCSNGTVPAPNIPPMPGQWELIRRYKEYWENPRRWNNLMALVSSVSKVSNEGGAFKINGELRQNIGDVIPQHGKQAAFGQIYCVESVDEAEQLRLKDAKNHFNFKVNNEARHKELLGLLEAMIRQYHPLAIVLKNARQIIREEEEAALARGEVLGKFYLVWEATNRDNQGQGNAQNQGGTHSHRLTIPGLPNQCFAVYYSEDYEIAPKGLWFGIEKNGSNGLRPVKYFDTHGSAGAYPLIFVFGQEGWVPGTKKLQPTAVERVPVDREYLDVDPQLVMENDDDEGDEGMDEVEPQASKKRLDVSLNQHCKSLMYDRTEEQKDFNPVNGNHDLSQYHYIDCNFKVQEQRLEAMQKIEEANNLRYDKCKTIREALEARMERSEELRGKKLGRIILLKKTFKGGRRYMQEKFKNNIALCNRHGMPSFFVTFTGNPFWREIQENLRIGEKWYDRPDLICRVFNMKARYFLHQVLHTNVLGDVKAYSVSLEHQKRGMPHLHMLLIMKDAHKCNTAAEVDELITAQLPILPTSDTTYDDGHDMRYYKMVNKFMIHDPVRCGSVCGHGKQPNVCGKDFPKAYSESTIMRSDGYAQVKRPDDGRIEAFTTAGKPRNVPITNQYVIPHNRYLLLRYNCHINLEHCGGVRAIKYLYKYIFKGQDMGFFSLQEGKTDSNEVEYNEIKQFKRMRVVGASEAVENMLSMFTTKSSHCVQELEVHLASEHTIAFHPDADEPELRELSNNDGTEETERGVSKLTAFFKLVNQELEEAAATPLVYDEIQVAYVENVLDGTRAPNLLYHQIPEYYTWDQKEKVWNRRKNNWNTIGRLQSVYPSNIQLYCMRELLKVVKGPKSYEDLKTVGDIVHDNFRSAAVARGLYVDDQLCFNTMDEVIFTSSPRQCRNVFALLLVYNQPANPQRLWMNYWNRILDAQIPMNMEYSVDHVFVRKALGHIASILFHHGKTLKDYGFEGIEMNENEMLEHIAENYPVGNFGDGRYVRGSLNDGQGKLFDKVDYSLKNKDDPTRQNLICCLGSGGFGKTHTYNTMIHEFKSQGFNVIAVASTGIAAILLDGGTTAHCAFKLPLDILKAPSISHDHPAAILIRKADLIIWDEAPMQHRACLTHVANLIKNLLTDVNDPQSLFGNKTVVLGGDFKQLLPVMRHETARASYEASLLCSELFRLNFKFHTLTENVRSAEDPNYASWLSDIGHGRNETSFGPSKVQLPFNVASFYEQDVIDFVYPDEIFSYDPERYQEYVSDVALLTPLNATVERLNEQIISKLPGASKDYIALNSVSNARYPDDEFFSPNADPEILENFEHSSIPSQKITLKVGSVVMLTRNLDIRLGLCNGTRMVVVGMHDTHILGKILAGTAKGQVMPIFALPNTYSDSSDDTWPEFIRTQLPIRPAFAMSINKSQGQTLRKVGVILNTDCFSHGQFYVAMSRVRSRNDIKVFVRNSNTAVLNFAVIPYATNIVFKEVITALEEQQAI